MISFEVFLLMLLMVSLLTGLFTEAIKVLMNEYGKKYHSNTVAGIVAIVLSIAVGIGFTVLMEAQLNLKMAVVLIALMLLSWLSAIVGYDKVIQTISQLKTHSS